MRKATAEAMASREKYSSTVIMPDIFKTVKDNVSILEAIERYGLNPIRKGQYYWLNCPFHAERTPSLCIYPETESFHCFGCGAHGDVIDFVSKLFNIPLRDAALELANNFNLTLHRGKINNKASKKNEDWRLYNVFKAKYELIFEFLTDINKIYRDLKLDIKTTDEMTDRAFVEACHMQDLVEHWLDVLLSDDIEDILYTIAEVGKWLEKV